MQFDKEDLYLIKGALVIAKARAQTNLQEIIDNDCNPEMIACYRVFVTRHEKMITRIEDILNEKVDSPPGGATIRT